MDICKLTFVFGYIGIIISLINLTLAFLGLNNLKDWSADTQIFVLLLSCIVVNTSCIAGKTNVNIK